MAGLEPTISWLRVQYLNHSAIRPSPWHVQGQRYQHVWGPNFHPLLSYSPIFGKVHWMTSKWPWHVEGQQYQHACYILPRGPIFARFALRWAVLSYGHIFGKVHRMTPNDLHMVKVKNTNMHATYPHPTPRPKFLSVLLYNQPFSRTLRFLNPHWLQCKNLIISNS